MISTEVSFGRYRRGAVRFKGEFAIKASVAAFCSCLASGCVTTQGSSAGHGPQGEGLLKQTFASDDPCSNSKRNTGILIGAIGGALLGKAIGNGHNDRNATIVGAGIGALAGGLIGSDMDKKRCELARIAKQHNLDMQFITIGSDGKPQATVDSSSKKQEQSIGQTITIRSKENENGGGHFESDSAELTPKARLYFAEIALQFNPEIEETAAENPQDKNAVRKMTARRKIMLVGHTDDTGSSEHNAELSERRARAVAQFLKDHGVPESGLYYQGAGETQPVTDNSTDELRAKNRRVEIVQIDGEEGFKKYLEARRPNYALYRPSMGNTAKATITKAAPAAELSKPSSNKVQTVAPIEPSIDFGGNKASLNPSPIDIGKIETTKPFNIISSAHASDDMPIGTCAQDRPRISRGVKALSDGKESAYSTSDYLPGVYKSSWSAPVNGHLVALTGVAVLRDGGAPAGKPTLLVYKNYKGDVKATPAYRNSPEVNTYKGDKALLYRVFSDGPVKCMDVVIPDSNPREALESSKLVYARGGELYQAKYPATLARK